MGQAIFWAGFRRTGERDGKVLVHIKQAHLRGVIIS